MSGKRTTGTLALALFTVTLALYAQTYSFEFLHFDDDFYVTANPTVQQGLTAEGIRYALFDASTGYWYPVTMLSHMLDVEIFGMEAGSHHVTNAILHAANAAVFFLALAALTGAAWPSALAAALFALHPLRVESVAWIAERKDVLSGLGFALTLLAYARYAARPSWARYLAVAACLTLGLAAKPMLVTVPCVLLLLDFWPLGRLWASEPARPAQDFALFRHPILEKLPLFAVIALFSAVVLQTQGEQGLVSNVAGLEVRIGNAFAAIAAYLGQSVWPVNLAVFYPHPITRAGGPWNVLALPAAIGLLIVVAVTAACWWWRKSAGWLAVGWLWFVGMLVPVLGLVQIGSQARADRYTYLPAIGLSLIAAFGIDALVRRRPALRSPVAVGCGVWLLALSVVSGIQIGHWRSTAPLFEHARDVTEGNYAAHNMLGYLAMREGRYEEALQHIQAARDLFDGDAFVHYNLGYVLLHQNDYESARYHLERAIAILPRTVGAHLALGALGVETGDYKLARRGYAGAARARPGNRDALGGLATVLAELGRTERAAEVYDELARVSESQGDPVGARQARLAAAELRAAPRGSPDGD